MHRVTLSGVVITWRIPCEAERSERAGGFNGVEGESL